MRTVRCRPVAPEVVLGTGAAAQTPPLRHRRAAWAHSAASRERRRPGLREGGGGVRHGVRSRSEASRLRPRVDSGGCPSARIGGTSCLGPGCASQGPSAPSSSASRRIGRQTLGPSACPQTDLGSGRLGPCASGQDRIHRRPLVCHPSGLAPGHGQASSAWQRCVWSASRAAHRSDNPQSREAREHRGLSSWIRSAALRLFSKPWGMA